MTLAAAVLAVLATVRLTLLVTHDTFPPIVAAKDRLWLAVFRREQAGPWDDNIAVARAEKHPLVVLVSCPWCISFWFGVAAVCAAQWAGDSLWFRLPALALTASLASGLAAGLR